MESAADVVGDDGVHSESLIHGVLALVSDNQFPQDGSCILASISFLLGHGKLEVDQARFCQ